MNTGKKKTLFFFLAESPVCVLAKVLLSKGFWGTHN